MKTKLTLNKETVLGLNDREMLHIKAGIALNAWGECRATLGCDRNTGGCTDGCATILRTAYHCTDGHCTRNCAEGFTELTEKEYTSGR